MSSSALTRSTASTSKGTSQTPVWRKALRAVGAVLGSRVTWSLALLAGLGYFVSPEVAVRRARAHASECLAQARQPRGPKLRDCRWLVREFDYPTGFDYTFKDATYRAEELLGRSAMNAYVDAAVGDPDPARRADAAAGLKYMQSVVERGSQRISLDELGPTVVSPHMGKLASLYGDRATLVDNYDYFGLWYTRRDTLEAALLEADFDEVDRLAHYWAGADPKEPDWRPMLGAALCITAPREGLDLLSDIPQKRAEKRGENMQRNFGEISAVIDACARAAEAEPPPPPTRYDAGIADVPEVRLLTALRLATPGPERARKVERAIEILKGDSLEGQIDLGRKNLRVLLLAAVLAHADPPLDAAAIAAISRPRDMFGEAKTAPAPLTVSALVGEGPGLQPAVPVATFALAVTRFEEAFAGAPEGAEKVALSTFGGALHTAAAAELATSGEIESAGRHAERGAALWGLTPRASALSVASALWVAGDAKRALARIDAAPREADPAPAIELRLATLEALTSAAAGDRERAVRVAGELRAAALASDDAQAALEARWTAIAFAPSPFTTSDARPPWARLASTGQADPLARWKEQGEPAIRATIGAWADALVAGGDVRRAFRWALMDRRGDMPVMGVPFLAAGDALLDGNVSMDGHEVWLDALAAIDSRRFRLRSYAWMRREAAHIRGDAVYAAWWDERLTVLRALAASEADFEATRFLRF